MPDTRPGLAGLDAVKLGDPATPERKNFSEASCFGKKTQKPTGWWGNEGDEMSMIDKMKKQADEREAFIQRAKARQRARQTVDPARKNETCVSALKRLAERFIREGDSQFGKKISDAAVELEKLLRDEAQEREAAARPMRPYLADAQAGAVAELCKRLPKVFACEVDAQEFIKPLLFSEARLAELRERDERRDHERSAIKIRRRFIALLERTATEATGEMFMNRAIEQLMKVA